MRSVQIGDQDEREDVLDASPRRPALFGAGVLVAFVSTFALWSAMAPVSGAAIADGSLQVEGKRQSVQHPYGGVVDKLLVREGQRVEKGQVLLVLSDAEPRAKLDVLIAEQAALQAEEARLIAERDGQREPAFGEALRKREGEPGIRQAMANERAVMVARRRQHDAELGALRQRISQLKEQIRGAEAQLKGVERQRALLEEEADGARKLLAQGFTPKTRVLALERDAAKLLADQGAKTSEIARAKEAIGEAELEIAKSERAWLTEITNGIRGTQARLAETAPKVEAARDVLTRTQVTAPATGAVVGLSIFTEGGVVQPGARLLDIVPSDNPMMVEAKLRLADVNEVVPGRSADVRLTGFKLNERPKINGEVTIVSADRLTDERSGQGYYAIHVRLDPADVRNAKVDLQAGMPAQVIVTTRPRTLIDYLVSPLADEFSGAFRER